MLEPCLCCFLNVFWYIRGKKMSQWLDFYFFTQILQMKMKKDTVFYFRTAFSDSVKLYFWFLS